MQTDDSRSIYDISFQVNPEDPFSVAEAFRVLAEHIGLSRRESNKFATVLGVAIGYAERDFKTKPVTSMLLQLLQSKEGLLSGPMLESLYRGIEVGLEPTPDDDGGSRIVQLFKKAA